MNKEKNEVKKIINSVNNCSIVKEIILKIGKNY